MAGKIRMLYWTVVVGTGVMVGGGYWLAASHSDVPRLEVPTDLDKPLEFRAPAGDLSAFRGFRTALQLNEPPSN